jgi:photosystem II stability/assembly factor-like uncharacterized protein
MPSSPLRPRALSILHALLLLAVGLAPAQALPARAAPAASNAAQSTSEGVNSFGALSADKGWLVLGDAVAGQRLYWTQSGGQAWKDVTPSNIGAAFISAAEFLDAQTGWLVLIEAGETGESIYTLARTRDGGQTWPVTALKLIEPGEPEALAEKVYLDFIDAQTGWLVVKHATSRNFSVGTLFKTADGGETWTRQTLPLGEPVRFVTPEIGWVAGGVAGDELYRTLDGGASWQAVTIPSLPHTQAEQRAYQLPAFDSPSTGVLPVLITDESGARLELHATSDGGESWRLQAGVPDGLTQVKLATPLTGWATTAEGSCTPGAAELDCSQETGLLRTLDGGQTWEPLPLPSGERTLTRRFTTEGAATRGAEEEPLSIRVSSETRWQLVNGQGFDSCVMPFLSQMEDWLVNSPYRVWNLYIGGAMRANCGTLTASYLTALAAQGWRLIPTWVGPQAACSSFSIRMSSDPSTAYQQGVAEANAAIDRAAALGLTFSDKSGTIIYYDLEAYFPPTGDTTCRAAAKAFINGWTAQLHARGNLAGVYGATCRSYISDFAQIANVPDAVWLAVWLLPYQYRSNVSLFNLACLDNSLWRDQQRLRQYSGGHNETWGATTLNIDSNVLGGPVADIRDEAPLTQAMEIYRGADYIDPGACSVNQPGWFNVELCGTGWNDQVSSLRVQSGWSLRVFRDINRTGPSVCFVLSDPDLTNDRFDATTPVDNHISSIQVYRNEGCLDFTLYFPFIGR